MKTPALRLLPNTKIDDKIFWIHKIMGMSLGTIPYFFYPRIYKVTDIAENVSIQINNFITICTDIIWVCRGRITVFNQATMLASSSRKTRNRRSLSNR